MGTLRINGKTPTQIKRGIQCHVCYGNCEAECPYDNVRNKPRHECIQNMTRDAFALIKYLEQRIEKQNALLAVMGITIPEDDK